MKRIGIIGAMEVEVANLKQAMKNEKIIRKASAQASSGTGCSRARTAAFPPYRAGNFIRRRLLPVSRCIPAG